jgi:hypothetical protein
VEQVGVGRDLGRSFGQGVGGAARLLGERFDARKCIALRELGTRFACKASKPVGRE